MSVQVGGRKLHNGVWNRGDISVVVENPPVQNQWYQAFYSRGPIRPIVIYLRQTNSDTATKTLEIRITRDGVSWTGGIAFSLANGKYGGPTVYPIGGLDDEGDRYDNDYEMPEFSKNLMERDCIVDELLIEYRITSALGTGQQIACGLAYEYLAPIHSGAYEQ